MADEVIKEKVYCHDGGDSAALTAALMGGRDKCDPMAMMAAMNGGGGNWNNNPWMYLIFLALFGNGGFGGNRQVRHHERCGEQHAAHNRHAEQPLEQRLATALEPCGAGA
jgi:hypothetical protein